MKKVLFIGLLFLTGRMMYSQNIGINSNGALPHTSAMLDVNAAPTNNTGILIPRIALTAVNNATPVASPATSLLVYNTATAGSGTTAVSPGYYYWDGAKWVRMQTSATIAGDWNLLGNTGTTAGTNFIGTTDAQDLVFKTNNTENARIVSNGNIGIGTNAPVVKLHINSTDGIVIPSGTTGQQPASVPAGTMRFNTTLSCMEVFNGICWQNINTPPIGSTYLQWSGASDPNTLYPCTVWQATDLNNGQFIRAEGGNSNITAGTALTGVIQTQSVEQHSHTAVGTAASAGTHTHNWGSNWNNDDSRLFTADNGNGNGNTLSDGRFWWGGDASTGSTSTDYNVAGGTTTNGAHNHTQGPNSAGVFYSDPLPAELNAGLLNGGHFNDGGASGISRGGFMTSTDGNHSHSVEHFAHRHWIKSRPTTSDGAHTHTVNITVGNVTGGTATIETRPSNVAVRFWRRVS